MVSHLQGQTLDAVVREIFRIIDTYYDTRQANEIRVLIEQYIEKHGIELCPECEGGVTLENPHEACLNETAARWSRPLI